MSKQIIMSGMRPTGRLHMGNMMGALTNWVKLQNDYKCFFSVADWHALTTGYSETSEIKENIYQMILDWLSVGLDPDKCTIFIQSDVKEIAELHLLLSMITPLSWAERCPTYKEQLKQLKNREINTYGFLGYPILQAADILICKANKVPAGRDQEPHIELAREIARRFNYMYDKTVFPEPESLLTKFEVLPGIDGRKMSKSYKNYIEISATPDTVKKKIAQMKTDPARIKKDDPGHPDVCNVYTFYKAFDEEDNLMNLRAVCKKGKIGCVQCKKQLADLVIKKMEPIWYRRNELEKRPKLIYDILKQGADEVSQIASRTLEEVRDAMKI